MSSDDYPILPDDYLVIKVTMEDVRTEDIKSAAELLDILIDDDDTISAHEGKLFFDVSELSEDDREPSEIEEVRDWFAQLDRAYPYLPFFLTSEVGLAQIPLYTSFLVSYDHEGDGIRFNRQKLEQFAVERIKAVVAFCGEHQLDPRESVRLFCERLHLQVLEEMKEEKGPYPFEPEKITSPFLIDFFETGYYFHTIDASDEPVLFALVDEPKAAYYAPVDVHIDLFNSSRYPVIVLDMTVHDIPETPLKMSFVYNVDLERHREELYAYTEMSFISTNFLFKQQDDLFYGFTRAIDLSGELRERIRSLILDASNLLRTIPPEARDFPSAVEEMFSQAEKPLSTNDTLVTSEEEQNSEPFSDDAQGDLETEPLAADEEERTVADVSDDAQEEETEQDSSEAIEETEDASAIDDNEVVISESEGVVEFSEESDEQTEDASEFDEPKQVSENAEDDESIEILDEIDMDENKPSPDDGSEAIQQQQVRGRIGAESGIPTSVLPESIQRITKALSKPIRRPQRSVTEELAIQPAPKRVIMRDEDQLERLSRRLVIMQNNLERTQRENMRLHGDLQNANEEIERLRRDNLDLESRWWKFWK